MERVNGDLPAVFGDERDDRIAAKRTIALGQLDDRADELVAGLGTPRRREVFVERLG
jgi:hypothetical protein